MGRNKSRKADEPTDTLVVGGHQFGVPAPTPEAPPAEETPADVEPEVDLAELEAEARKMFGERKTVHLVVSQYGAELRDSETFDVLCSFDNSQQAMHVLAEYASALEAVYIGGAHTGSVSVAIAHARELLEGKEIVRC